MTLKEIEAEMRRLDRDAQRRDCPTPFKVDCYELTELADALKAERERIERFERDFAALSRTWEEHPQGWDHWCECQTCQSYSDICDLAEGE